MTRALALAAALAGCIVFALLTVWGYLWTSLVWSPRGQGAFFAAAFCALLGAQAAVRCALEDRRARA